MGMALLVDVLSEWSSYELDDDIYLPPGKEPSLELMVSILPFDPTRKRIFEGQEYFLGIEQIRDVIDGLEAQLGRVATPLERLRAAIHYARYDAFIDPRDAVDGQA
jgi:hypothetical protein